MSVCYLEGDLALPRSAWGKPVVWALGFMQERFHNRSPSDYEGTFINVGDSKTRRGLT